MNMSIHLDELKLHNFRCFEDCALKLHQKLTVLVAENGQGKTALLDGIGIAFGLFIDTIAGTRQLRGFDRTDVRLVRRDDSGQMEPILPTSFSASAVFDGRQVQWSRALTGYGSRARTTTRNAEELVLVAQQVRDTVDVAPTGEQVFSTLPLVAFYGTGRLWSEHRLTEAKKAMSEDRSGRLSGYTDCLSSSSSFKGAVAWYENKMLETKDARFSSQLKKNLALLSCVQQATRLVLEPTGWHELDWDFDRRSLVVSHPIHGQLPLSALSDGVRNMIAIIADIARRCASLNPHLGESAARLTPGLLLIDEVDMHLHPKWQQLIVGLMRTAFPALQMVFTTHSPHVLSTVDKECIRVIHLANGKTFIETPTFQTRGVESADVLASIMSVDPVPQIEEAKWLSRYRALIEDGNAGAPEATELQKKLVEHFGANHPLMTDCERLTRFQAFKVKRAQKEDE